MKQRVKIDRLLAATTAICFTAVLYLFPRLFVTIPGVDNLIVLIGLIIALDGNVLRMAARGHKKARSNKSNYLVTSGPYTLVRNPMYLGSFLIGAGFVLIAWPWWMLPMFTLAFYLRFKKQIAKEEIFLHSTFGNQYKNYCAKVPRFFPALKNPFDSHHRETFDLDELFSTKETWGLLAWPILAILLKSIQEKIILGHTDIPENILIFSGGMAMYAVGFLFLYKTE